MADFLNIFLVLHFIITATNGFKAEIYNTLSFEIIHQTSYPHFVMFYAPWCGHCKRMQTLWDQFAEENDKSRRIKIAKVDCTENTPLCASENIKAYPTLRLFNANSKYTFRGSRNIPDFVKFATENIGKIKDGQVPDSNPKVFQASKEDNSLIKATAIGGDDFERTVEHGVTFVDFYAPWCPHCVKLEPIWDQLATRFKQDRRIKIVKVDCTSEPVLCTNQMITAYPTLNLYIDGIMLTAFHGVRQLDALVAFVSEKLNSLPGEINSMEKEPNILHIIEEDLGGFLKTGPMLVYLYRPRMHSIKQRLYRFRKETVTLPGISAAVMNCDLNEEFCKKLHFSASPKVVFFATLTSYVVYTGEINERDLQRFAVKFLNNSRRKEEL